MMSVLTFVFSSVFAATREHFWLFVLIGLLPYNFFALAWSTGTESVVGNAPLIKHVPFQRELVPVSVVLGNTLHYLLQLLLLLIAVIVVQGVNISMALAAAGAGAPTCVCVRAVARYGGSRRLLSGRGIRGTGGKPGSVLALSDLLWLRGCAGPVRLAIRDQPCGGRGVDHAPDLSGRCFTRLDDPEAGRGVGADSLGRLSVFWAYGKRTFRTTSNRDSGQP